MHMATVTLFALVMGAQSAADKEAIILKTEKENQPEKEKAFSGMNGCRNVFGNCQPPDCKHEPEKEEEKYTGCVPLEFGHCQPLDCTQETAPAVQPNCGGPCGSPASCAFGCICYADPSSPTGICKNGDGSVDGMTSGPSPAIVDYRRLSEDCPHGDKCSKTNECCTDQACCDKKDQCLQNGGISGQYWCRDVKVCHTEKGAFCDNIYTFCCKAAGLVCDTTDNYCEGQ